MSASPFKDLNVFALRRQDERGYLDVIYEQEEVVLKRSFSRAGVFRGMHWQSPPHAQIKIIRVVSGRIIDFVFDPLKEPAHLHSRELVPSDGWIQINANLAHGFYAVEDTEFEYLCLGRYVESSELSFSIVNFLHSNLGLTQLVLSEKDKFAKPFNIVDSGLHL